MQEEDLKDAKASAYAREPATILDGIPVFATDDAYSRNYERIAADHLAHASKLGENPFISELLWNELEDSTIALVKKYSRANDRVLDAGVGLGRVLAQVPHLRRYGVDISIGYLKELRDTGIDVCLARLEDLPYRESFFDIVVCTDVLEHVLDLNLSIARLLTVLKPAGTLIVRVPYREDLAPYTMPDYPYDYAHLRAFDEHSLTLLFSKIFRLETLEWTVAGWWPDTSRLKSRHSRLSRMLFRGFASLAIRTSNSRSGERVRRLSAALRSSRMTQLFFFPIGINFVLRKSTPCAE